MRRPAVFASVFFGAGIFTALHVSQDLFIWSVLLNCAMTAAVAGYLQKIPVRHCKMIFLLCIMAAGGVWLSFSEAQLAQMEAVYGEEHFLTGTVKSVKEYDDHISFIIEGTPADYLVNYYDEERLSGIEPGCTASVYGKIEKPQGRRNPGTFNYELYLKSCGVGAVINAESYSISSEVNASLMQITSAIKNDFEQQMRQFMDEDVIAMVMAIMFGDKTGLDESIYEEFRNNGTAHVLAVSGLHVGILYSFFVYLWRWKKGAVFYSVVLAVLLFYTAMADFSPSVVRASVMITLHLIALILHRRYDLLSAAGVTFILMLVREPYQLFNTGFQLSFLAVLSLGVMLPYVKRVYSGIFLTSVTVQAGMLPYTAFVFNYVSLSAFIVNVPMVFIAGILLPAGLMLMVCTYGPEPLFALAAQVLSIGCELMIKLNSLFYVEGFTGFDVVSPHPWMLVIYYGTALFITSETGQIARIRKLKGKIAGYFLCLVVLAASMNPIIDDGFRDMQVVFVDVGQGDCIHIRTPEGRNYLVDGGGSPYFDMGEKTLKPYLLKNGVKIIDGAFVTHLHEDHYGGIKSLAEDGMIDRLFLYEACELKEKELKKGNDAAIEYLYGGQKITLGKDVYVEVLAPGRNSKAAYKEMIYDENDENKTCLILKVTYRDVSVLITGDIDSEGEEELLRSSRDSLRCDIVKVPHHGSRYSSSKEFISAVSCSAAVFQVGKNNYGHPDKEIIERYRNNGVHVFRNDVDGAIGIKINRRGEAKVICMID